MQDCKINIIKRIYTHHTYVCFSVDHSKDKLTLTVLLPLTDFSCFVYFTLYQEVVDLKMSRYWVLPMQNGKNPLTLPSVSHVPPANSLKLVGTL